MSVERSTLDLGLSAPRGAVFLSYAREDAAEARRIAEALRAAGLEVWFDEKELRGGDEWDAHIRQNIRECALFMPIISAQTQARAEGYFRREWKQADHRTEDMGRRRAFLVPVCVDDTKDGDADVPDSFLRVQWTRLPGGLPTPAFVEQVKKLVQPAPIVGASLAVPSEAFGEGRDDARGRRQATPRRKSPRWTVAALVAVAIGIVAAVMVSRKSAPPAPSTGIAANAASVPSAPDPVRPPQASDKSIAVLPFANMSSEKENEFFSDGIHEDILTNLAMIRDVRVVSRTSVMQYRGTTKPISQIAAELKVTYVLEGSVRRSGNKVRVTGQLIRAATDEHLWAKAYDRDLTDVFTIQGELATAIAGALQSVLTPEARSILEHRPTDNPAAYDLYLKARQLRYNGSVAEGHGIIALLEQAVELDPRFAPAWAELASRRAYEYFNIDHSDALLARAREAIETAARLAPDDPAVIEGQGDYYYYGYRDYARATENYARLAQLRPNDPALFWSLALIQRRQGRFADAWRNFQRALELDPANATYATTAIEALLMGRRYREGEALARKWPDNLFAGYYLAMLTYSARGTTAEMTEFVRRTVPPADRSEHLYYQRNLALMRGDWAEVRRLDGIQRHFASEDDPSWAQDVGTAAALAELGDLPAARTRAREALAAMRAEETRQAGNDLLWVNLAVAHAMLGNQAESMRCREKALALMPPSRDAIQGTFDAVALAGALAWCGEKDRALAEFELLLQVPWGTNIYRDRGLWAGSWQPLRDDPRFQALLADPKNNQPLF